jgi:hypothetical protein
LEATYPGNSGQGAEILGFHLRRKFRPGDGNSGPPKIFILKIPARNFGPLLKAAPQLERKDLAKICRPRISGPFLQAIPQPFVKDLAKFLRVRNYGISGPRKFCQIRISGPFTERFTTTFCKGLSRISKGQKFMEFPAPKNFVQGQKFRPWGRISSPETKFPAL